MTTGFNPNYDVNSPYGRTSVGSRFMGYYQHRFIGADNRDRFITINDERYVHRPDLLSYDIYGTVDWWWVIPLRNSFEDLVFDLEIGMRLAIPDQSYIQSVLGGS